MVYVHHYVNNAERYSLACSGMDGICMGHVAGSVERYCQICRVGSNSGERVIVEQHHTGDAGRCSFACSEVVYAWGICG